MNDSVKRTDPAIVTPLSPDGFDQLVSRKKRVLMDLNMTARWCREGVMVGIVRVACEMFESLQKLTDTYMVQLVRVDCKSEPEIRVIDPSTWELTDQVIRPTSDDLYLMPEIQIRGIHVPMDYPWPAFLAAYGVDRCALIHDILPIEMPEYFESETASRMPEYVLGLFRNYNQIICVSKSVCDSVSAFWKQGLIRPFCFSPSVDNGDTFFSCFRSGWQKDGRQASTEGEARIWFSSGILAPVIMQCFIMNIKGAFRVLANSFDVGRISVESPRSLSISIPAEIISPCGFQEILLIPDSSQPCSVTIDGLRFFSTTPGDTPVCRNVFNPVQLAFVHEGVKTKPVGPDGNPDETVSRFFSRPGNEKVFLMVGTIEPRKGHELVLDTFEYLWDQGQDHKLCIVGKPGWNMDAFVARLRSHPQAGKKLLLLDHASDQTLRDAYRQADALIQASAGEGFGLPLIEAGQYGIPVLCSDIPVFHEVGGDNVLYFPRSVDGLAECIAFFSENCNTERIPDSYKIGKRSWDDFAEDCYRLMAGDRPWPLCLEPEGRLETPRKKVIVALTFSVWPPVNGGQARVFGLYRNLAREYDVELICMAPHSTPRARKLIAPHLVENVIPMSAESEAQNIRFESRSGVPSTDMSLLLFGDSTPEYTEAIREAGGDAEWIVACHPYPYHLIRSALPDKTLIYEAQDVEYLIKKEMYQQNAETETALQKLFSAEKECCLDSKLIMTCSEADRQQLAVLYAVDLSKIVVVPNGVDTDEIEYVSVPDRIAAKARHGLSSVTLGIFMGGYHEPNLNAAKTIIQIAGRIKEAKIFLLGSQCQYFENRDLPDNIALMGFLSDEEKRRVFSMVDFALNPMMSGSGTNLKMFDYMAAGIPVITTAFGSRGIDRKDLFITVENEDLAEAINSFDLRSCETMVSNARKHMVDTFSWKKISENLVQKMVLLESEVDPS